MGYGGKMIVHVFGVFYGPVNVLNTPVIVNLITLVSLSCTVNSKLVLVGPSVFCSQLLFYLKF